MDLSPTMGRGILESRFEVEGICDLKIHDLIGNIFLRAMQSHLSVGDDDSNWLDWARIGNK